MAHLYDNLLTARSTIRHVGEKVEEDEQMSPTVERLVVLFWLHFIDDRLPGFVSRIYAKYLQSNSFKDLQPQISIIMQFFLKDLNTQEDIKVQFSSGRSQWSGASSSPDYSRSMYKYRKRLRKGQGHQNLLQSHQKDAFCRSRCQKLLGDS